MASPAKAKRVLTPALLQAFPTLVERPFELRQPTALQEPETAARLQQLSVDIAQRTLDGGISGTFLKGTGKRLHGSVGGAGTTTRTRKREIRKRTMSVLGDGHRHHVVPVDGNSRRRIQMSGHHIDLVFMSEPQRPRTPPFGLGAGIHPCGSCRRCLEIPALALDGEKALFATEDVDPPPGGFEATPEPHLPRSPRRDADHVDPPERPRSLNAT